MFKEMVGFAAMTAMAAGKEVGSQVMQAVFDMANTTAQRHNDSSSGSVGSGATASNGNGTNNDVAVLATVVGTAAVVTVGMFAFLRYCNSGRQTASVSDAQEQPTNTAYQSV